MIKILHASQRTCPIVVCDICGDMISDVLEGAAVFGCRGEENAKSEVLHAHKGKCHDKAEERFGQNAGWDELGRHLYLICLNTGIKYDEEAARHKRMGEVGL